jgi:hypothetical protein
MNAVLEGFLDGWFIRAVLTGPLIALVINATAAN